MENKKIKICSVANNDTFVKFLLIPQLRFLMKEGYDVSVACSQGKWIPDIEKEGIKVKTIKIKRKITPFYDIVTLYRLWSYFRKERFDIVHTNNPKPGLLGQVAAKMAGVPIIINTVHGFYFQNNSSYLKRRFFIVVERFAAKCSSLILFVNKEDMETALRECIGNRALIKYLGGGVNVTKFNHALFPPAFISAKKEKLAIPKDHRVVGIVARLVQEKGYLDLFEAFRLILKKFPKTTLLVVGAREPEKNDAVHPDVVKEYGIEKNVIFLGERNDVDQIYPLMDVFVLPSYREGLGVAILEAMAEERPVVASDIRGCNEEIDNGKNGILIPVKSPDKLAAAIMDLFGNQAKAKELGENARLKVEEYFNENLIFERMKNYYGELIEEKLTTLKRSNISLLMKRILDVFFALLLLLLFSPIMIIIAILIKLDSRGPVFYQGERVGKDGVMFNMCKFRTMIVNAQNLGTIHASRNDPRITPVGGFLRTCKFDELPQLFNILKGEMSFVGPRPQVKHYVDLYTKEEKKSLSVRPGMTDYATIYYINQDDVVDEKDVDGSYQETIEPKKNELRLKYVNDNSLFIDAAIIFKTIAAIIKKNVLKLKDK